MKKHGLSGGMVQIVCSDNNCGCVSSHDTTSILNDKTIVCGQCGQESEVDYDVKAYAQKIVDMEKYSNPTENEDLYNMAMFLAVNLDDMGMIEAPATRELCESMGYNKEEDYT